MKPWQRGVPLEQLSAIRTVFDEFDRGLCLGAFTAVKETKIAEWIDRGQLWANAGAFFASHRLARPQTIKGFTGEVDLRVPAGALVIERFAGPDPASIWRGLRELCADADAAVAYGFVEHAFSDGILEDADLLRQTVKIRASSELIGVYARGCDYVGSHDAAEMPGLSLLSADWDHERIAAEIEAAEPDFVDHYSGYNKRGSWHAVALRSFGGDPLFIEKPAEMSRKWKADHPEALDYKPEWTPLAEKIPTAVRIAEAFGQPQRVRLMRLASGGMLSRHADITDREAGVADGKLARLHIPIQTNDKVEFASWGLDGSSAAHHMAEGQMWYLDTRKPHAAINGGQTDRIHLVFDVPSNEFLRAQIVRGRR